MENCCGDIDRENEQTNLPIPVMKCSKGCGEKRPRMTLLLERLPESICQCSASRVRLGARIPIGGDLYSYFVSPFAEHVSNIVFGAKNSK
jgi:hypothetical protein